MGCKGKVFFIKTRIMQIFFIACGMDAWAIKIFVFVFSPVSKIFCIFVASFKKHQFKNKNSL